MQLDQLDHTSRQGGAQGAAGQWPLHLGGSEREGCSCPSDLDQACARPALC